MEVHMTETMPGSTADAIQLTHCTEQVIYPCPPFHFDGTVYKPSYFPGSDLLFESGRLWHSLRFEDQLFGLRIENQGTVDQPAVRLGIYSPLPLAGDLFERIIAELAFRYDFYTNLSDFYNGFAEDPLLAPVLVRWRGVHPSTYSSLYEYLVIATLLQNATVRRTVQMAENLFARFGSRLAYDGRTFSAYWDARAIRETSEEELRGLKVGYRARTLKRQAESFGRGGLEEARLRGLPTAELKRELQSIYGVGPASVWYLLFGQFKRCEAFEYISPWEQKIYSRVLFDQELVEAKLILAEVDRRWGRWKMLAAHLIFEDLFWQHRNQPIPWLGELIHM
jgi:3-methyladenine DNA glycosylase/8-oxoguanine DNA glycosylase